MHTRLSPALHERVLSREPGSRTGRHRLRRASPLAGPASRPCQPALPAGPASRPGRLLTAEPAAWAPEPATLGSAWRRPAEGDRGRGGPVPTAAPRRQPHETGLRCRRIGAHVVTIWREAASPVSPERRPGLPGHRAAPRRGPGAAAQARHGLALPGRFRRGDVLRVRPPARRGRHRDHAGARPRGPRCPRTRPPVTTSEDAQPSPSYGPCWR